MQVFKRIFLFLIALIFINFSNINVCLANNNINKEKTVVVGLDSDFPPMGFLDEKNEIIGFDIDLAKAVGKEIGINFKFQPINWDAKEMELNTGKIDVIWNGLTYSKEREQQFLLTKPYMKTKPIVVINSKINKNINKLEDIYGRSICLQKGALAQASLISSEAVNNAKETVCLETMLDCLNEVRLGKIDAAIVDDVIARYYLNKFSNERELKILEKEIPAEDYVIAVKKGNEDLKNLIEEGLEKIVKSGKAKEISEKWFGKDLVCFNVKKESSEAQLKEPAEKNKSIFQSLLNGLSLTLKLFSVCLLFSIPLGLIVCLLRRRNIKVLNILIDFYTLVIRSTPLLLQIFFLFYGLPLLFPFIKINNRFLAGSIAFIINYTAYFSEIFRGGINSIASGQWEATKVLRIPKTLAIKKVILPQSLKACLPSVCNETITLIKDTALIFSIGLVDLLSATKNIVNTSANVSVYAVSAVIYLIICSFLNTLFKLLEKKFNYKN